LYYIFTLTRGQRSVCGAVYRVEESLALRAREKKKEGSHQDEAYTLLCARLFGSSCALYQVASVVKLPATPTHTLQCCCPMQHVNVCYDT